MKKLSIAVSVLAILVAAGSAGAVVAIKTFTVKIGQQAHLAGTDIYCVGMKARRGTPSMECAYYDGRGEIRPGTVSAYINKTGLFVYSWNAQQEYKLVKQWSFK